MKKILIGALCVIGFLLIAAPIYMNQPSNPVLINGKKFANAYNINGVIAISVADFAKAAGGTLTLEQAGFQLQGNVLSAGVIGEEGMKIKVAEASAAPGSSFTPAATGSSFTPTMQKVQSQSAAKIRQGIQLFHVQKAGQISSHVFMEGGKAYFPLADLARAFGGTFTVNGGTLKPGQSISLNFTKIEYSYLTMN